MADMKKVYDDLIIINLYERSGRGNPRIPNIVVDYMLTQKQLFGVWSFLMYKYATEITTFYYLILQLIQTVELCVHTGKKI